MNNYNQNTDQHSLENLDRIDVLPLDVPERVQARQDANLWRGHYDLIELKTTNEIGNLHEEQAFKRLDVNYSLSVRNSVRRWSEAISLHSRDRHLPSRKVFDLYNKLLLNTTMDPENEIWQVVTEIVLQKSLVKKTEQGEHDRLELLRRLPQSLTIKRYIKARLSIATSEQHLTTSNEDISRFFIIQKLSQMKRRVHKLIAKVLRRLQIWAEPIKEVTSHYGPNISAYFEFLRMLLLLNTFGLACCVVFIVIPQKLYDARKDVASTEIVQKANHTSQIHDGVEGLLQTTPNFFWNFLDLLTGRGFMQSSLMFYGAYTNASLELDSSGNRTTVSYSLPQAYFITMLVLFLLNFIFMTIRYSHKIFSSWNYGISNQKCAEQNYFAIFTDLKEYLSMRNAVKEKTFHLIRRIFINTLVHILVILLIMAAGTSQWMILKTPKDSERFSVRRELSKAFLVNTSIIFLEWIFALLSRLERYLPSLGWTLHIHLIRCFILEMVMIGVFLLYWLGKLKERCWESLVGTEIYRLIISEIIMATFFLPIIKILLFYVTKRFRFSPNCYDPYFNISQRVIYSQTLCWLGLIFAPLIAIVIIFKALLQFYLDRFLLRHIYEPSRKYWCDASLQSTYLGLKFLALTGVIISYGYITTHIPLTACGPFRDYKYIFEVFLDGVLKLRQDHIVWRVLKFCMRPAVVGGVLIMLTIMVYLSREKARAYKLMTKYMKEILIMKAKDKDLLLQKMANIGKNEEV